MGGKGNGVSERELMGGGCGVGEVWKQQSVKVMWKGWKVSGR